MAAAVRRLEVLEPMEEEEAAAEDMEEGEVAEKEVVETKQQRRNRQAHEH